MKEYLSHIIILLSLISLSLLEPLVCHKDGLVGYHYSEITIADANQQPLSSNTLEPKRSIHILGTDSMGRDVLASIIHGIKISFFFAIGVILLACLIGFIFAGLSIVHLIERRQVRLWKLFLAVCMIAYLIAVLLHALGVQSILILFTLSILFWFSLLVAMQTRQLGYLCMDDAVVKLFELIKILPALLILIVISGSFEQLSLVQLGVVIAALIWVPFARLFRGEFMTLSQQDFVLSAKASGARVSRILLHHILPNAQTIILARICFGLVGVILLESTLSYLGLGLPVEEVTLGTMISDSRNHLSSWWMAVFPGMVLFLLLYHTNRIGSKLSKS